MYPNPPTTESHARVFTYQWVTINRHAVTVLDIAITLTVQTQQIDPVTTRLSDRNQGALERVAPECLQHLDDGRPWLTTCAVQSTPPSITPLSDVP